MYVKIEMSLDVYDCLVKLCAPKTREYVILKNGLIFRRPDGDRYIDVFCVESDAQKLLEFASTICPKATGPIKQAIASPRCSLIDY